MSSYYVDNKFKQQYLHLMKMPFYLTKRTLPSGKKVYYYYTYKEDGTRSSKISTGCAKKSDAIAFCTEKLKTFGLDKKDVLFSDFQKGWFEDGCLWLEDRKLSKNIKKSTILHYQQCLRNYLLPYFKNYNIGEIMPSQVKDFRLWMSKKNLSNKTINHAVGTFRLMMEWALERELIKKNPVSKSIKPLYIMTRRDAFTKAEIFDLLCKEWTHKDAWLFALTGAITGMRFSEILGLQHRHLKNGYIEVSQQYYLHQLTTVKTGENRFVTAPQDLINMLKEKGKDKDFIFYSPKTPINPCGRNCIIRPFNNAFSDSMTKTKEERKLTFHSLRHFFNTYLVSRNISESKINFLVGHSTGKGSMMATYTSWKPEMYSDVLSVQEELLQEIMQVYDERVSQ